MFRTEYEFIYIMEDWDSEWFVECTNLRDFKSEYIDTNEESLLTEYSAISPEVSGESEDEKSDENSSKNDSEFNLNKLKNVALAKKRLQAYTKKPHVKKVITKLEKTDDSDKNLGKKSKKGNKKIPLNLFIFCNDITSIMNI